jgi:hypothetical protein
MGGLATDVTVVIKYLPHYRLIFQIISVQFCSLKPFHNGLTTGDCESFKTFIDQLGDS